MTDGTPEFRLKPISIKSVTGALRKAERYRLINDPSSAESICLDVLAVDANNQQALVDLVLAISDQMGTAPAAGGRRIAPSVEQLRADPRPPEAPPPAERAGRV